MRKNLEMAKAADQGELQVELVVVVPVKKLQ